MEEGDYDSIGFMFDAEHKKENRIIDFGDGIRVEFKLIGDQPGHVQSGQYLWPAASFASFHLINHWKKLKSSHVLELGSGCGLTGLVASKLSGVHCVIFTDYDRGSLDLIRESISLNGGSSGVQCIEHYLEWGATVAVDIRQAHGYPSDGFKLIIGTDLLYCVEVVEPLFQTVAELLRGDGIFMLTTSFSLDNLIEKDIKRVCHFLRFDCEDVVALDEAKGISKIQYFKRRST